MIDCPVKGRRGAVRYSSVNPKMCIMLVASIRNNDSTGILTFGHYDWLIKMNVYQSHITDMIS